MLVDTRHNYPPQLPTHTVHKEMKGYTNMKFNQPLRVIELFAGYGSQALALKYLGIPFEHHCVCEFDDYAIQSYNEIHNTNFNKTDIRDISANDLNIVDLNNYKYLVTYSFPCTDLSLAGKQKGMSRNSGTRSSLLWEVERLLNECGDNLPQYLLMENVPQVICPDFKEWTSFLCSKGYTNTYEILDAEDFNVPQHRERVIMVSILKSESNEFTFPKPTPLTRTFMDLMEDDVPDKLYISTIQLDNDPELIDGKIKNPLKGKSDYGWHYEQNVYAKNSVIRTIKAGGGSGNIPKVLIKSDRANKLLLDNKISYGGFVNITYDSNIQHNDGIAPTLTTRADCIGLRDLYGIRKLSTRECFRLMGVRDEDYNKLTCSDQQKYKQAGNSIVVDVLMAVFDNLFVKECKKKGLF